MNAVRPGIALTALAAVAVGSAVAIAPAVAVSNPVPALKTAAGQNVMLAGFIADFYDQWIVDPISQAAIATTDAVSTIPVVGPPAAQQLTILFNYAEEALSGTVYLADDLVTPIVNGQFWPVSGQPGTYLVNAFNSTLGWAQGLASSTANFIQAEIDWFTGGIANLPNAISAISTFVYQAVQGIIAWINPWHIYPGAAVAPSPAAAKVTSARAAAGKRPLSRPAAAGAAISQSSKASHSAAKQSSRVAASRAAAKAAR